MSDESGRKTLVLTGASRGIGHATVKRFSVDGWRVITCSRQDFAENCPWPAGPDDHIKIDLSDPEDVGSAVAEIRHRLEKEGGRLNALVNNAGVADFGPIEKTDFARWRTVMATNLDGVFLCSQAAIPHLKASRGAIVNIASISGLRASTLRTAYGTSKAAVIHLTQQQAAELARLGLDTAELLAGAVVLVQ